MNKKLGKKLEALLKQSAEEQGWDITRLKDAGFAGVTNNPSDTRRFTVKNICDFIMFKSGHLFYIEVKHSLERLTFTRLKQQKDLMKKHANGTKNVHTGYLLKVREYFYYVSAYQMQLMIDGSPAKSLNQARLLENGYQLATVVPKGKKTARINLDGLPWHIDYE